MNERKQYYSLDVAKFLCAILIIILHTSPFKSYSSLLSYGMRNIVTIIAVPFFFITSGFLFFVKLNSLQEKERKSYFVKYIKRLVLMYVIWSAVYFPFVLNGWLKEGATFNDVLLYIKRFFFEGSYSTIWFLPALISATFVVYALHKKFSYRTIFIIAIPFYVFACLGSSYYGLTKQIPVLSHIFDLYFSFFDTVKNGMLFGFVFVALGGLLSEKQTSVSRSKSTVMFIVFYILLAIETVIQSFFDLSIGGVDTKIILLPLSICFFVLVTSVKLPENYSGTYVLLRKLSLLSFLSQRIFLTLFEYFLENTVFVQNSMLYFFSILTLTVAFSYGFIKLSDKVKLLKYFY